ncbi:Guanine-nucleotide dissociation stimulator CDC25 [Penicillium chermesinum]|nr:Guanine-nucleotide dissociation stimulator CDC25 [Penicillium chermesinum]
MRRPKPTSLEKTYAHELIYKEGHVMGGSLRALIEKLTAHQSTPDALFVSTFYLTFRLFASPLEFAQALAERFEYVGDTPHAAGPVRLRVYNIFKGWLESHWRHDRDNTALDFIVEFAKGKLSATLPTPANACLI